MSLCHGLTGGIGSGKSTVARLFADLGARIVDTDLISHQLTQPGGAAIAPIEKAFGAPFINGEGALDRTKMRELIFADVDAKRHLEAILHPLILAQTKAKATSPSDAPYTLVIVPLLFESSRYRDWLNTVIVVDCSEQQQIERTAQRSGLKETDVRVIMSQQMKREKRLQLADEIIRNEGDISDLRVQVEKLHSRLIHL